MLKELSVDAIKVDDRKLNYTNVRFLMESIHELGLLQPVLVRKVKRQYELVVGRHRLQAFKELKKEIIPAIVIKADDLHAELAAIDENLIRNEIKDDDMAVQVARRKQIYLELYPETGKGKYKRQDDAYASPASFTEDTAQKTGKSKRTIERLVAKGEEILGLRQPKPKKEKEESTEELERAFRSLFKRFPNINKSAMARIFTKVWKELN